MMKDAIIYKYQLRVGYNEIDVAAGAKILCVQQQDGMPVLYALVEAGQILTQVRRFVVTGTGSHFNATGLVYIGTVMAHGGTLVWHVFEETGD